MSENTSAAMATSLPSSTAGKPAPRVGFVSLGCPKALTDSELILTRLSAEGYETSKTFEGADLVIVNTCGFIDDAVRESLDTIGEALAANGKVIVTGCLGAKAGDDGGNLVKQMHPSVQHSREVVALLQQHHRLGGEGGKRGQATQEARNGQQAPLG